MKVTILPLLLILNASPVTKAQRYSFSGNNDVQNLIYDASSKRVFVGGTNKIFRLSDELKLLAEESTGPVRDRAICYEYNDLRCRSESYEDKDLIDNENKILLINQGLLINCGSVYGGRCSAKDLSNLKDIMYETTSRPTSNSSFWIASGKSNTIAIAGSGLLNNEGLFVATEKGYQQMLGTMPFIASYYLNPAESSTMFQRVPNGWAYFQSNVKYYYMFKSASSYFHTVGKEYSEVNPFISRTCMSDRGRKENKLKLRYKSYAQIKFSCEGYNSEKYYVKYETLLGVTTGKLSVNLSLKYKGISQGDDVLIAVFYDDTSDTSAVCPYPIDLVNAKIDNTTTEGGRCSYLEKCRDCYNLKDVIKLEPLGTFPSNNVTSMMLLNVKDDNVLIVGTKTGEIRKIVLRSDSITLTVNKIEQSGAALTKLVASPTHVYAIAGNLVTADTGSAADDQVIGRKVIGNPLGECSSFTSCESCVGGGDPLCGWCLLKAQCMQYSQCDTGPGSGFKPERWVNSLVSDTECFPVEDISPPSARITAATKVAVTTRPLVWALESEQAITCDWEYGQGRVASQSAILDDGVITCTSPVLNSTLVPADTDNILVSVKLVSTEKAFWTLFENFPLYFCANNKQCSDCTSSPFPCKWCKDTNKCLHTTQSCSGQIADEVSQCPALQMMNYTMEESSGGNLVLAVSNIVMPAGRDDYKCLIDTDTRGTVTVSATPSQNSPSDQTIQCTVPLRKMTVTAEPRYIPLVVTYKNVPIRNPDNSVQLIVYSCPKVSDCSTCKGLDPTFGCTWCLAGFKCTLTTECSLSNQVRENKCSRPGPIITKVYPLVGPVKGGTLLTIEGVDLSIKFSDISNITVGGYICELLEEGYLVSTRVMCRTREVQVPLSGRVVLSGVNGQTEYRDEDFQYLEATISAVSPLTVLKTGGTNVTITGEQLDMGTSLSVSLGGYPCDITSQGQQIVCRTTPVDLVAGSEWKGPASVTIDRAVYSLEGSSFMYIDIPDVNSIKPIESIVEGGINMTFNGNRGFNAITSAQIYLVDTDEQGTRLSDNAKCYPVKSDSLMVCNSPRLYRSITVPDSGKLANIFWILEESYEALLSGYMVTVYPNPAIFNVDNKDKSFAAGEPIFIRGNYFDRVRGIQVFLKYEDQTAECDELEVFGQIIKCVLPDLLASPDEQSPDYMVSRRRRRRRAAESDSDSKSTIKKSFSITVKLGNFESEPIQAEFIREVPEEANIIGIVGACVAAGIVVLILMFAVCILHKRRLQQKKQFKHMMFHEMEKIEMRLAEECKQVFTELQTDLADLNSDFSPATIPYHSFDEYALKILFPGQEDYPVLHDPPDIASYEDSLTVFEKLVKQEQFLLTLVETLDSQRQVSKRDKSNIAALMIVSLMDDMNYTTLILRRLLSTLITDTVTSDSRRVKLLLRRSEHITEKYLSNWLTFNLYSFLIDSAGQPLYVLYRAIKQQIEKGPVDYITGNARYALHEKNLLSKITDFHKLNVMVYLEDDPYLNDTAHTPLKSCQVSLLSCDTISQAKGKIIDAMYRTVPDSLKPTPNDVDVDWKKNGSTSSLRLVDMLHNTQDGWKQLDTLGSLNIDDQAVFQCIPRQSPPPFMSQSGGAPSCNSLLREIDSGRVWHLEREVDTEGDGKGMTGVKTVPEVFLTRLSATKIPLQKFVDDLFNVIFTPNEGITSLPPCIKYLMDFLDSEAARLQITDPEVLHTWKNNALPLRYWISIIKSPDVVFDVRKNNNIDSCLSVIAQTFIDATYYEDMMIDKTSQSSRLLYCKEIPTYKQHVREFYGEIQTCRPVGETEVESAFTKNKTNTAIRQRSALYELFNYSCRFSEEVREALTEKGLTDLADQFVGIADNGLEHSDSTRFDLVRV